MQPVNPATRDIAVGTPSSRGSKAQLTPGEMRAYVRRLARTGSTKGAPVWRVRWTLTLVGFLLYLLVITSYRLPIGDVAIALALAGIVFQGSAVRFPAYLGWLTAFLIWAALAGMQAAYPDLVVPQLVMVLKMALIVFVAANALQTRGQTRLFMVFFLGCFALFPLRGAMFNFFLYHNDMEGRAIWNYLYNNPNDLGAMALLQLSMAVALLVSEKEGWIRWSALAGVIVLPMLILMTQSRGVFLGLVVFLAIAFAGQRRRLRLFLTVAMIALVLGALLPAGVTDRIGTLRNATSTSTLDEVDGESGSARQRYEIWRVAFKMIRDHPIVGVGLGAYKVNHERYALDPQFNPTAQGGRDTHSLYFNVLAETGYPGLALYLGMLIVVVIRSERTRRRCKGVLDAAARQLLLLEAGLAAFLTASIFGSLPYLPHFLLHLVLLHALAILYQRDLDAVQGQRAVQPLHKRVRAGLRPAARRSAMGMAG